MASWKNVQYKNGQYRTSEGGGGSSTLSGLDDVTISSASNGQVLKYNSTSSKWVNANETDTSALSDLTDVDVDTKSDGDVLTYNEAQDRWEAAEPLGGGVNDVEVDGLSVVNDGVAEITTPDASGIEYDNQQSGLSATDVQSAIDELSQSTGVSTLNDLTDTAISSPSNNQVLTYDSSTSKWKNANATGGASTLNDLTDVDTTGVLDNNFLAYSSGQSKWVPATVSGGNVDDVIVNGTSVVDVNKVAQITSYKELTRAEYDLLPDTKYSDGIMYCISDGFDNANGFPPLIYSTEEREVGVWVDGKPLYQKTINIGALPNATSKTVAHNISNLDFCVNIDGAAKNPTSDIIKIPHTHRSNITSQIQISVGATDVTIITASDLRNYTICYVTLHYTKTTDIAGSGRWATDGGLAKHYSTSEQIIGTWIDGKPLYEKVITLASITSVTAGTWKTIYTDSFVGIIEQMIKCLYIVTDNSGVYESMLYRLDGNDLQSYLLSGTVNFSSPNKFIIQYTKTTD